MGISPFNTSKTVWLFRNIITKQVVLSPCRVLSNHRSLAQLPPNRRLHPEALRKDHWVPLLKATFADNKTMNQIYARMMAYRQWRAQEPVPLDRRAMRVKARRRLEIDQVATSIADLSASCEAFAKKDGAAVTIDWLNEEEKVYAEQWPANVRHGSGLDVIRGWSLVEDRRAVLSQDTTSTSPLTSTAK